MEASKTSAAPPTEQKPIGSPFVVSGFPTLVVIELLPRPRKPSSAASKSFIASIIEFTSEADNLGDSKRRRPLNEADSRTLLPPPSTTACLTKLAMRGRGRG